MREPRTPLTRAQQREFMWRMLGNSLPLAVIPVIIVVVQDTLYSSVLLSIATGSSTLIMFLQDYLHYRAKGSWLTPRLATPLIIAGTIAMLVQILLYTSGIRGIYYIGLQILVMVMFIHSGLREWKRWF